MSSPLNVLLGKDFEELVRPILARLDEIGKDYQTPETGPLFIAALGRCAVALIAAHMEPAAFQTWLLAVVTDYAEHSGAVLAVVTGDAEKETKH